MTARKSGDQGKVAEPKADETIKAEAEAGPVIDLEAEEVSELVAEEKAKLAEDEKSSEDGLEAADKDQSEAEADADDAADAKDKDDKDEDGLEASDDKQDEPVSEAVEPAPVAPPASTVPASAPAEAKKGGAGSGLIGGLLGGVVALGLGYGGLQQGLISVPTDPSIQAAQDSKLSGLEGKLSELQGQLEALPKVDVAALEKRIGEAEAGVSSLSETLNSLAAAPSAPADSAPSEDVAEGEAKPPVILLPDLSQFKEQLAKLEEGLTNVTGQVEGLKSLDSQLSAAKLQLSALEKQASEQAAAVEKRLGETKDEVLANAERRINVLVTDVADMGSKFAATSKDIAERMGALEDNNLSEKMQSSARTIALAGLENAVASGQNFSAALNTFGQVAADNEAVKALKAYAEKGVPTASSLAAEFRTLSGKLLKAAEEAGATNLVDKIMLNAQNLVRIRPIGEREGEALTDKLARIEVRVSEGRLGEISKEWDGLPDAAKESGKSWYEGVQARLAVDGSMDQIRSEFGTKAAQ